MSWTKVIAMMMKRERKRKARSNLRRFSISWKMKTSLASFTEQEESSISSAQRPSLSTSKDALRLAKPRKTRKRSSRTKLLLVIRSKIRRRKS